MCDTGWQNNIALARSTGVLGKVILYKIRCFALIIITHKILITRLAFYLQSNCIMCCVRYLSHLSDTVGLVKNYRSHVALLVTHGVRRTLLISAADDGFNVTQ